MSPYSRVLKNLPFDYTLWYESVGIDFPLLLVVAFPEGEIGNVRFDHGKGNSVHGVLSF